MKKTIMAGIDGSVCGNQALEYIAGLFGACGDVHFHLAHCVQLAEHGLTESLDSPNTLLPIDPESKRKIAAGNRYLRQAEEKAHRSGVDEGRCTSSLIPAHNIAGAIQSEAERTLADALMVARRGLGFVGEMLFGSVSAALFQKCRTVPLWIVDGAVRDAHILLAVDGSPASMMAADHAAYIFSERNDIHFFLFHCRRFLASEIQCDLAPFYREWDKEWVDAHLAGKGCLFRGPARTLLEAGIPEKRITVLPEARTLEESMSIISHAKKNGCGTIIMGRRRGGMAKGLFGETAGRTIFRTHNMALWLVG